MPVSFLHVAVAIKTQNSADVKSSKVDLPTLKDSNLKVQLVFKGLKFATSMAFLGPNDILVLDKNSSTVKRIVNGRMLEESLLHVNVTNRDTEQGLLGIAISKPHNDKPPYVFLYLTECTKKGNPIECSTFSSCKPEKEVLRIHLYRYEFIANKLVNPKLLLDLPGTPGTGHYGGAITIGPDNNIYIPIGDIQGSRCQISTTKSQNWQNGTNPDGRSGILRITQEGKPVPRGSVVGNKYPLNLYYAYGIRNSFGIDFDPVTKKLWDTENGPEYGDEINLVEAGFNSGWEKVQGIWKPKVVPGPFDYVAGEVLSNPLRDGGLVDFNGTGKYSPPEFIWNQTVAPTAIKFLNSDKLGKQYKNDMVVGDVDKFDLKKGTLYHFDLNKNRTQLDLHEPLLDKIANSPEELEDVIFGKHFGGITDIEVGPDGYLYILSTVLGSIYRIAH
jgi:glucose/arabinose dehydrogenase